LAESLVHEERKTVTAGANPMGLKRGLDRRVEAVLAQITKLSKPTKGRKEIAQVASISSNNDKPTGDLFADAMAKVGRDGVITFSASCQDAGG
jgi:chaperonin GroEL